MIKTKRLNLQLLSSGKDSEKMLEYRSLPEIYEYQTWAPSKLKDVIEFIEKYSSDEKIRFGSWKQLAIYSKEDNCLIGDCGFNIFDSEQATIGYTISPEYQKQGFATETVRALINFMFKKQKLHRILAQTDPENIISIKILLKCGFSQEAHHKKSIKIRGVWKDDLVFALLREDWERL